MLDSDTSPVTGVVLFLEKAWIEFVPKSGSKGRTERSLEVGKQ